MRDKNFLIENNAKPIWHPMAHPAEMRAHPPRIIMKGDGVHVTDIDGRRVIDAVGGLWTSISATAAIPSSRRSRISSMPCPSIPAFAAPRPVRRSSSPMN